MIQDFALTIAPRTDTNSLSDLRGATIGIDASFYLSFLLTSYDEPLLTVLGGLPLAFRHHISIHLEFLRQNDITPIFVFNGLDIGRKYMPFKTSDETTKSISEGWDLYVRGLGQDAVKKFGQSKHADPEQYNRLLQSILHEKSMEFIVAPYDSAAQLAYLLKSGPEYVDAVVGSLELLLYDIEKVITSLEFSYDQSLPLNKIDYSQAQFTFVTQQACIEELGLASHDQLVDACILSGSSLLPTLPTLSNGPMNMMSNKIRSVVDMMKRDGQTGLSLCLQLQDDESMKKEDYVDRYRRSRIAIKHQIVLQSSGRVRPFEAEQIPSDLNALIGQRLPEELYYYLSIAILSPGPLNQLTSAQIFEVAPTDGGESAEYRSLIKDKLTAIRSSTLALLSSPLHRAYQFRDVVLRCWFDQNLETIVAVKGITAPGQVIQSWHVRGESLPNTAEEFTLKMAVGAARSNGFGTRSKTKKDNAKPLKTKVEIKANTLWRFLHIRDYINDQHELTSWGLVLNAALSPGDQSNDSDEINEAVLIAIELLRYGLLNANNMFPTYTGAPIRGSTNDKRNTLLVSRVASLLSLRHKPVGYVGPLSRHILGYASLINAVRSSLRDLLEVTFTTLLLNGDADRDVLFANNANDLTDISLKHLPCSSPSNCGLGVAMKDYLDHEELAGLPDNEVTDARKQRVLELAAGKDGGDGGWFSEAVDLRGDLKKAWLLWDKVYAGVQAGLKSGLVKDKELWETCNEWTKIRRT